MQTIEQPLDIQKQTLQWRQEGHNIGFVPTMGFLHEGHLSLIKEAKKKSDKVIVSIFINPTQFGANEDLDSYPQNIERDKKLLKEAGCDLLFFPTAKSMYSPNATTWVETPSLAQHLCAVSRPTHFRGVCTVVAKLFLLTNPHYAFFGKKDWQQLAILRRMSKDLAFPIKIIGCPIIREEDGLAKSSRNTNLTREERVQAVHIHKALNLAAKKLQENQSNIEEILAETKQYIERNIPLGKIDYLEAVDPHKITPITQIENEVLFAVAVQFSVVRLIDNKLVKNRS